MYLGGRSHCGGRPRGSTATEELEQAMFSAHARRKGTELATLQTEFDAELDHDGAAANAKELAVVAAIQAASALLVAEMPSTAAFICTIRSHGGVRADGTGRYTIEVEVQ